MIERSTTQQRVESTYQELLTAKFIVQGGFIVMGHLLCRIRDEGHWEFLGKGSFWEYVDELQIGSDQTVERMMGIVDHIVALPWVKDEGAILMGNARCQHLLPLARHNKLTQEFWEDALKTKTDMDVRRMLGHKTPELKYDKTVRCPNCGNSFPIPKRKEK